MCFDNLIKYVHHINAQYDIYDINSFIALQACFK